MDKIIYIIPHRFEATEQASQLRTPAARKLLQGPTFDAPNKALQLMGHSDIVVSAWGWATTAGVPVNVSTKDFKIALVGWYGRSGNKMESPGSVPFPAFGRILWQGVITLGGSAIQAGIPNATGGHPLTGLDPGEARDYYAAHSIVVDAGFSGVAPDVANRLRANFNVFDGAGDNGVALLEVDNLNVESIYCYVHTVNAAIKAATKYGIEIGVQLLDWM